MFDIFLISDWKESNAFFSKITGRGIVIYRIGPVVFRWQRHKKG